MREERRNCDMPAADRGCARALWTGGRLPRVAGRDGLACSCPCRTPARVPERPAPGHLTSSDPNSWGCCWRGSGTPAASELGFEREEEPRRAAHPGCSGGGLGFVCLAHKLQAGTDDTRRGEYRRSAWRRATVGEGPSWAGWLEAGVLWRAPHPGGEACAGLVPCPRARAKTDTA